MTDLSALKKFFDLVEVIEQDLGPGRRSGRWRMYHCPFPGHAHGDRRPSLAVTPDNGRWHCFTCGCSGDVLSWLRLYRQLSWKEIWRLAGHDRIQQSYSPSVATLADAKSVSQPINDLIDQKNPPDQVWQQRARKFVRTCETRLWERGGEKARSWLYARGLKEDTIRHYQLGYNPQTFYEPASVWGLPDGKVWLPRGILIPCIVDEKIWYLKIRRSEGKPKYAQPRGGKSALFGADDLRGAEIILLTEGELDCALAEQELGDVLGVATLGSAAKHLDLQTWGVYLLPARLILTAYDFDAAGRNGSRELSALSARIRRLRVPVLRPGDKDLTDYHKAGGDLWQWLRYQLQALGPSGWNIPEGAVKRSAEHNQPDGENN